MPDVHPEFPNLRLSTAPIMQYWAINSDTLVDAGPKTGQFKAEFQCVVKHKDGSVCGVKRTIYHLRGRGISNTNLKKHLKEEAAKGDEAHTAALATVEESSKNMVLG